MTDRPNLFIGLSIVIACYAAYAIVLPCALVFGVCGGFTWLDAQEQRGAS